MQSKTGKLKGKIGSFAKEREEFEQKRKQLQEEMAKQKQNMGKIRKSIRHNDIKIDPSMENDDETESNADDDVSVGPRKSRPSSRLMPSKSFRPTHTDSSEQSYRKTPIPSGPKISDWCYTNDDSAPPVIKTQDMYEEVRFLGRGAYGTVDLVKNREDNRLYAVKSMLITSKSEETQYMHEVTIMKSNRHPYVVQIHDVFLIAQPRRLFMVLHYCEGGDLGKVISHASKTNTPITENNILKWMCQIGLALQFLHEHRIVHRDVKPCNILLADSGEMAQLGDFGLAEEASSDQHFQSTAEVGTPYYTAPEMIQNEPYSYAADNWSLGVVLYELLFLQLPFDGVTTVDLVKSIISAEPELIDTLQSDDMRYIVTGLLKKSPAERLSMADMLQTPVWGQKALNLTQSYRPKHLEERLRRAHHRQLTHQLEKLGISAPSSSRSMLSASPKSMSYGNLSDLKRNNSVRDMTTVGSIGNISTIVEDGGSVKGSSAVSTPTMLSCSPLTAEQASSAAGTPVGLIISSHSGDSKKEEEEAVVIVTSVKDIALSPPKKPHAPPTSSPAIARTAAASLNSPSPVPFSEPEVPKNPSPILGKSPRPSLTRQIPVMESSPRRKESNSGIPSSNSGGALSSLAGPPSARSNGYDEPVTRSQKDREAAIAALEAPDPLLDGEHTGIGALDHAMHYLKRHGEHHDGEHLHHHHQLPRSARSGHRSSRPQSSEVRDGHKHHNSGTLPPLNAHHNMVVTAAGTSGAVFVPRRSRDTYPDEHAWEANPQPAEGMRLDDLLNAAGAATGEGKKYQRRLSISR